MIIFRQLQGLKEFSLPCLTCFNTAKNLSVSCDRTTEEKGTIISPNVRPLTTAKFVSSPKPLFTEVFLPSVRPYLLLESTIKAKYAEERVFFCRQRIWQNMLLCKFSRVVRASFSRRNQSRFQSGKRRVTTLLVHWYFHGKRHEMSNPVPLGSRE